MVPESQHLNSTAGYNFLSSTIVHQSVLIIMTAPIEFDAQFHSRAIEVDYVRIDRMLAAKLVACKIPIP
jgi:hypothetical protein